MKAVVWYNNNIETAKEFIKTHIQKYELRGIKGRVVESKNFLRFYADNGDYWETRPAYESSRGVKCNISYIERGVPEDFINCVIRPCTIAFPFNAIDYYGNSEEDFECLITE